MARDTSTPADPPSAWLARFAPLIAPGARVLEIACGNGRNTRLLARLGAAVTAVDMNPAPELLEGVRYLTADLEAGGCWPFERNAFDVVVGVHYLWRPIFPRLFESLRTGGLFLYETFTEEQFRIVGRPSNPEHYLRTGELLTLVPAGWRILAYEDGLTDHGAFYQRIAARRCAVKNALPPEDVRLCQPR